MTPKNEHAAALGRLSAGKPKTNTPARAAAQAANSALARAALAQKRHNAELLRALETGGHAAGLPPLAALAPSPGLARHPTRG